MNGVLLDTNVLSELRRKGRVNQGVLDWLEQTDEAGMFVSVMTLGEIRKGIERLRSHDTIQATHLEQWLLRLTNDFRGKILAVTDDIADRWGRLQALRPLPLTDALIAATALQHELTLVTRNDRDFTGLGLQVHNPFIST